MAVLLVFLFALEPDSIEYHVRGMCECLISILCMDVILFSYLIKQAVN